MAEDKNLDIELGQNNIEQSADNAMLSAENTAPENAKIPDEIIEENTQSEDLSNIRENNTKDMITVQPVKFQDFELCEPNRSIKRNLDIMQDVSMHISVELGRAKSTIKEVIDLEAGSIVELDKVAGEQVEVYVNNKLVAKGEVIVIEDKFGVRITSTNLPKSTI